MGPQPARDAAQGRLIILAVVLFISYLCVAISLPVIPLFVAGDLGLGNVWAGLGVGSAFLATILTRGFAGTLSDRRGAKLAVSRGLVFYVAGGLVSMTAGLLSHLPWQAFCLLVLGRLLIGLGEAWPVSAWWPGVSASLARSGQARCWR